MNKPEIVKSWVLERIGCPYIYGGTGQPCTPEYRRARAAQYPDKAEKIKRNCPRMSAGAKSCQGCRWCDPETGTGKPAYDCAQLSRGAMAAVGISLVSGANSQWERTQSEARGEIDSMPLDKVCLVFRRDGDHMGHVGIYMGDGSVTHAKGHDWGVVNQPLEDVNFTHWLLPLGLYDGKAARPILRQGASGQDVEYLQTLLCDTGLRLDVDGKFGPKTTRAVKAFQNFSGISADGVVGPMTWAALEEATGHDSDPVPAPDVPDTDVGDIYTVHIPSLGKADAECLAAAHPGAWISREGE